MHDVKLIHRLTYREGLTVETTWNHPFWVQDKGWTEAKQPHLQTVSFTSNVQPGFDDPSLLTWDDAKEGTLSVAKVEEVHRTDKVYNIEVEGNHTYFVTEEGVLVHNYVPSDEYKSILLLVDSKADLSNRALREDIEAGFVNLVGGIINEVGDAVFLEQSAKLIKDAVNAKDNAEGILLADIVSEQKQDVRDVLMVVAQEKAKIDAKYNSEIEIINQSESLGLMSAEDAAKQRNQASLAKKNLLRYIDPLQAKYVTALNQLSEIKPENYEHSSIPWLGTILNSYQRYSVQSDINKVINTLYTGDRNEAFRNNINLEMQRAAELADTLRNTSIVDAAQTASGGIIGCRANPYCLIRVTGGHYLIDSHQRVEMSSAFLSYLEPALARRATMNSQPLVKEAQREMKKTTVEWPSTTRTEPGLIDSILFPAR